MGRKNKIKNRSIDKVTFTESDEEEYIKQFHLKLQNIRTMNSTVRKVNNSENPEMLNEIKSMREELLRLKQENERLRSQPHGLENSGNRFNGERKQLSETVLNQDLSRKNAATNGTSHNSNDNAASQSSLLKTNSIQLKDLAEYISKFDGTDEHRVENWIDEFENTANLFELTPLQKLVFAKQSLTGSAREALRTEPNIRSWNEIKNLLLREYQKKFTSADIHRQLQNRRIKKEENLGEYFLTMREIGALGNVEEGAIFQYVIDGVNDNESNKVILYGAKTVDEFREKLQLYEKIKSKTVAHTISQVQPKPNRTSTPQNTIICFNCGKKGHTSNNCRMRDNGPKCFRCLKFGHKAPDCPDRQSAKQPQAKTLRKEVEEVNTNLRHNHKLVTIFGYVIEALVDTGSDLTLLLEDVYTAMGSPSINGTRTKLRGIGDSSIETIGYFLGNIIIDGDEFNGKIHVVPQNSMQVSCIIGTDMLHKSGIVLSEKGILIKKLPNDNFLSAFQLNEEEETIKIHCTEYRKKVEQLIKNYVPTRSQESPIVMKLILKTERPIFQPPRRVAPKEKEEIECQINKWLQEDIIRPSCCEYASPIVLVNKKDGSKRLCIDYRKLNREVVMDRYPLPLIEDQIDQLHSSEVYSKLDLETGFFHLC